MIIGRKRIYENVLRIPEGRSGSIRVRHVVRPAGTPLDVSSVRTAFFGQKLSPPVVFDHDTTWHELSETGRGVWMTDAPIEQRQCDDAIVGFAGDVLVGGLGLGYATTAFAAKRHVRSVTVVERSVDVGELVWAHTGARIGKSELIIADLFDFLRTTTASFNAGFFDIWQSDGEQTFHNVVVPLRALAYGKVRRIHCWNEDVMRGQLSLGLIVTAIRLLSPSFDGNADVPPTIAELTTPVIGPSAPFVNWSIPFFRWIERTSPPLAQARDEALTYASVYGLPQAVDWMARRYGPPVPSAVRREA